MSRTAIIVPCYNEAGRLLSDRFAAFAEAHDDASLSFVDDGSVDETGTVLAALAQRAPDRIRVLRLERNGGKANAVRAGLLDAAERGATYVGYWDADLSTPLDEMPRFRAVLDARPEILGVLGSRVRMLGTHIERSGARHYAGRVFATLASVVLRLAVYDTQCGAKLFRVTPVVRAALAAPFRSRWAFDVELLARLDVASRAASGPAVSELVVELPLNQWLHIGGSKLRLAGMVQATLELLAVRGNAKRDVLRS
jgi:glycosyltransferase involved in cell wall biosynthesis